MSKANIYFSDGSIIEISENDIIITVTPRSDGKSKFSSIDKTVDLQCHLNNGLIPSILDALLFLRLLLHRREYRCNLRRKINRQD